MFKLSFTSMGGMSVVTDELRDELYQKLGELDTKALLDVCKDWSVLKDSYLCDCDKAWNFGKLCKYPEKYKDGGCK